MFFQITRSWKFLQKKLKNDGIPERLEKRLRLFFRKYFGQNYLPSITLHHQPYIPKKSVSLTIMSGIYIFFPGAPGIPNYWLKIKKN